MAESTGHFDVYARGHREAGRCRRLNRGAGQRNQVRDLPPVERAKIQSTPGSLDEALDALEADHHFLLKGDVFTKDAVEVYINYKRSREIDEIRLRPHPYEFFLYYDI